MEDDWDLHAVVRGCGTASTSVATADTDASGHSQLFSCTDFRQDLTCEDDEGRRDRLILEDLHDLYKPFFTFSNNSQPPPPPAANSSSSIGGGAVVSVHQDPPWSDQFLQQTQKKQTFSVSNSLKPTTTTTSVSPNIIPSARSSKRRKNNLKRVCHVPAESTSSDLWSWRKYGQKPIKGSPYPRGYYKCSTLKGCMARKQVERNRSDPGMFIITYTGDHNHPMPTHRNSLAGCTRQKSAPDKPSCSPETASLSRTPEKLESSLEDLVEVEDDDLSTSDMALDDDFLAGLEDLGRPEDLQFPWLAVDTEQTTTAAAAAVGLSEEN